MSRSIPTEDRISSLQDPILCHILSFLPTKFAATTTVLSKRWNLLWRSVPTLYFDDEAFKDGLSFYKFMSSVFLLRDIMLPLRSFHLKCSDQYNFNHHDISQFVQAAIQRVGMENLNLIFNLERGIWYNVKLTPRIFSCKTLVVLHLTGVKVNDLSHLIVDLPRLKTLHLTRVLFKRVEYLPKLLSRCPILEELHINYLFPAAPARLVLEENIEWAKVLCVQQP
ncbi:F-box/LRR-repeat protein, partial [Trifolium medium]|nr:F-box/LRR-repeat protein [Trifolium medium]